jgi:hypothetical protein
MPRGGKREGAGAKPKWNSGKTTVIRVPEALSAQVLEYARMLDQGHIIEPESQSKVVDLRSVNIPTIRGRYFVFLADLVKLGYVIKPSVLYDKVKSMNL